jgi:hypothetical protein
VTEAAVPFSGLHGGFPHLAKPNFQRPAKGRLSLLRNEIDKMPLLSGVGIVKKSDTLS